ncbi:MAG TPA: tetratricopeptide repeat protein [Pyrinomonadaceae bacterium]|nr:tetratricopeptide repeat protein [Pyrinomonadaceae bacterium]
MTRTRVTLTSLAAALLLSASAASAQSGATRPRRVIPTQPAPAPVAPESAGAQPSAAQPARPTAQAGAQGVARALSLLEQKQFEAALTEARALTEREPSNSDAWKIAGFAGYGLKRYGEAAADLQRAADLQKAAGKPDRPTEELLAESYFLAENYERALPLLASATGRAGAAPDARLLYYRAVAEQKTGRAAEAERTYGEVLKADPKNTSALFNLGLIAYNRNDHTAAINYLNRATLADPRLEPAWKALVNSYLRRAATLQGPKAEADYQAAVRAGESFQRLRDNAESQALLGQALLYAKQFVRAAAQLERAAASADAPANTDYLLGYAQVQAKNFPKAAAALERAAQRTPDNADVYRLLGFSYESVKQYAKALQAYERGLQLAPADEYFKESADRVRPFAR